MSEGVEGREGREGVLGSLRLRLIGVNGRGGRGKRFELGGVEAEGGVDVVGGGFLGIPAMRPYCIPTYSTYV